MMAVAKVASLLFMVIGSNAAPSAEECQGSAKRLPSKNSTEIYGEWISIWSVADHDFGHEMSGNLSSSHVEFKLLADNTTIEYIERNKFSNSCTIYIMNMTVPSDDADHHTLKCHSIRVEKDGVVQEYNETGDVDFYESCSDCLSMTYKTSTTTFSLSYRKEGSHQDVEQHKTAHDDHKKSAECSGVPHGNPYTYDGASDFCHKKSAPELTVEQS